MPVRGGSVVVCVRGEGSTVSSRVQQSQPIQGKTVAQAGISGASTGVKLSYTCPAGTQAEVTWMSAANFAGGAPTVTLEIFVGAQDCVVASGAAPLSASGPWYLNATDIAQIRVSVLAAGSSFDGVICAREYPAL